MSKDSPSDRDFLILKTAQNLGRSNAAKELGLTRQAVSACLKKWFPDIAIKNQQQPKRTSLTRKEQLNLSSKKRYELRKASNLCVKCSSDEVLLENESVCGICKQKMLIRIQKK